MIDHTKANTGNIINFIVLLIAVTSIFFPTSFGGEQPPNVYIIVQWITLLFILLVIALFSSFDFICLIFSSSLLLYLWCATIVIILSENDIYEFSIARLVPFVCYLLIVNFTLNRKFNMIFLIKIYDIIVTAIIFIDILLLLDIFPIKELVINYYTQYMPEVTANFIAKHRPICTFGVGNIAAFFYGGFFLIAALLYEQLHFRKYLYYMIIMMLLSMLILNTTGLGYACLMMFYIVVHYRRPVPIAIIICAGIYFFFMSDMLGIFIQSQHIGANGFIPRYINLSTNIFGNNIAIIRDYPLGIGYALPRNRNLLYYADSGYLISYTMGNILCMIYIYGLFYRWLVNNIKNKKYRLLFCGYVLLMELGYITFYSFRTLSFLMFIMIYFVTFTSDRRSYIYFSGNKKISSC